MLAQRVGSLDEMVQQVLLSQGSALAFMTRRR